MNKIKIKAIIQRLKEGGKKVNMTIVSGLEKIAPPKQRKADANLLLGYMAQRLLQEIYGDARDIARSMRAELERDNPNAGVLESMLGDLTIALHPQYDLDVKQAVFQGANEPMSETPTLDAVREERHRCLTEIRKTRAKLGVLPIAIADGFTELINRVAVKKNHAEGQEPERVGQDFFHSAKQALLADSCAREQKERDAALERVVSLVLKPWCSHDAINKQELQRALIEAGLVGEAKGRLQVMRRAQDVLERSAVALVERIGLPTAVQTGQLRIISRAYEKITGVELVTQQSGGEVKAYAGNAVESETSGEGGK